MVYDFWQQYYRLINGETVFFLLLNQILNMKDKSDKSIFDYTYREFKSLPVEDAIKLAGQDEKKYQEWCEQYRLEIQEDNEKSIWNNPFFYSRKYQIGAKVFTLIFLIVFSLLGATYCGSPPDIGPF